MMAIIETLALKLIIPVLLLQLPCLRCFKFTKEPQSPIIVVLGHNTTNVNMGWTFDAEGSTNLNCKIKRFLKNTDNSLSSETSVVYFASITIMNSTLYTFSGSLAESGYANFTIKDVLRRVNNADKTKVSFLSGEVYTYRLDVETVLPSTSQAVFKESSFVELKVYFPPTITAYFCKGCQNGSAVENQNITLWCNATGKPIPNITWIKNGVHYGGSSSSNKLVFIHVSIDDKGNYTCIADNGVGDPDRKSLTIFVKYKPKNTSLSSPKDAVCENENITISCTADAYPSVNNYSLYHRDNYIGSNSNGQFSTTARSLERNTFCCVASNEIGSSQCAYSYVYVLGNINATYTINNENKTTATVIEREKVVLQSDISGDESYYRFKWSKINASLPSYVRDDTRLLTFDPINRTDEGHYQVTLRDKGNCSSQTRSFSITVNYKPENTTIKISVDKKVFCEGDSIRITCTSHAKPVPVYSLYRNDVFLNATDSGVFDVELAMKGNYIFTCEPNNTVGVGPKKNESVTVKGPLIETCKINSKNVTYKAVGEGSDVVLLLANSAEMDRLNFTWSNKTATILGEVGPDFTIPSITRYQGGQYQVVARDKFSCSANMKCNFTVDVHFLPESTSISISPAKSSFCRGNNVTISCTSHAKPPAKYSLYHNTKLVHDNSTSGVFSVTLNDTGKNNYTCVPYNTVGFGQNQSLLDLQVKEPPTAHDCKVSSKKIINGGVIEGEQVTLSCDISGSEPLNITWTNGSHVWKQVNLTFDPVNRVNDGYYHVTVNNGQECEEAKGENLKLSVYYKPEQTRVLFSPNKPTVNEGENLTMTCKAEANPQPYYVWTFKGQTLQNESDDTISLSDITANGAGEYTCTAVNDVGESSATKTLMVNYIRESTCEAVPPVVKEGSNITLNCSVDAYPPANYTWDLGDRNEPTSTVVLNASPDLDKKSFTCTATNYLGSKNCSTIPLGVLYQPRYVRILAHDVTLEEFDNVNLTCTTSSNPASNYTWSFNGRTIEGANSSLLVKYSVSRYDAGEYKCTASNELGSAYNVTSVNVIYAPELKCKERLVVVEGQERNFSCNASAFPFPSYTVRYRQAIYPSRTISINLTRNDNGSMISCNASNSLGSRECKTALIVTYKPEQTRVLFSPNKPTVNEGENLTMTCKAEAYPKPYYVWIFKGQTLQSESNDTISLSDITANDAGEYTCTAVNDVGKSSATKTLMVNYIRESTCEASPLVVKEGSNITLNCSVEAYPPANYTWDLGDRNEPTSTAVLTASPELDKKSFTCTATNSLGSKSCSTTSLEVLYQPRYVRILAHDVIVKEFDNVNLTCTTSSNPASNYTWSFNGRTIVGANSRQLVKYNVSRYDAGEYKCTANNGLGSAYNVTSVNVMHAPELKCKERLVVIEGQERNFSCNASAFPLPSYTVRYRLAIHTSRIVLINLTRNDNGSMISCNASNSLGSGECKTALIVTYKPEQTRVLFSPNKPTVNEGENLTMTCKAEAYPKPYYVWNFKGQTLQSESNDTISLSNITTNDAGEYTCTAVNDVGKSSATKTLAVEYLRKPTCEAVPPVVKEGSDITLNCSVDAYPPVNYTWNLGDRNEPTSTVVLTASPDLDKKAFTCTATNSFGSKNCATTSLEVRFSAFKKRAKLKIVSVTFTSDLKNRKSVAFLNLSKKIKIVIIEIYKNALGDYFFDVHIIEFLSGSVWANFELEFTTTNVSNPLQPLQDALVGNKGNISGLMFNASSLSEDFHTAPTTIPTEKTTPKPPLDQKIIIIIVVIAVVVLIVIFLVIFCCCKKKRAERKNPALVDNNGAMETPRDEERGRRNDGYSPSEYAKSGPSHTDPAYDSVDGRKDAKDKNDNRTHTERETEEPAYAAVNRSKKSKKKTPGEVLYADLGQFQNNDDQPGGGRGDIVLEPLSKDKNTKIPPKHDESIYSEIIGTKKPGSDDQNATAANADGRLEDVHSPGAETDQKAQNGDSKPSDQTADPRNQNDQKPATSEENNPPGDNKVQPPAKEDSGKVESDSTEYSVTKFKSSHPESSC